jgi:tetratricopeptide (TPR) repeat protein
MGVRLFMALLLAMSGETAISTIANASELDEAKSQKATARTSGTLTNKPDCLNFDKYKLAQAASSADKNAGAVAKPSDKASNAAAKPADKSAGSPSAKPGDLDNPAFTAALNKGIGLFNKNKSDEAIVEFLKALELNPNNTAVRNWMGAAYQRMNKHDKAVEIYEQVIELDPNYSEAHNNLGFSYQQLQDYEKAENEYKRALELKPGFVEARFNLACVLQLEKKNDEAIGEFENVLKMEPTRTECYLHIGDIAKDNKDYDKALSFYNKALAEAKKAGKKDPQGMADILCKISLIDKEKGDKDKCKEGLEKVLDIDPANYLALLNLGICSFEEKDFSASLNYLSKALERNPYDAAVHFWLGRYFFSLDSAKSAIKQFEDCLKCDATEHSFPECQEWLDKAKKKQQSF